MKTFLWYGLMCWFCLLQSVWSFDRPVHREITDESLELLKADVLSEIIKGNLERDHWWFVWRKSDKWHFNDCDFSGSTKAINLEYEEVISAFNPDNRDKPNWFFEIAAYKFGKLLHAIQDFYAHSNWVELQVIREVDTLPLVNATHENWEPMLQWKSFLPSGKDTSIVVVQGSLLDTAFVVRYDSLRWVPKTKAVKFIKDGKVSPQLGLVSGKVKLGLFYFNHKAPDGVHAEHWDETGVNQLHKDNKEHGGKYHWKAREYAIKQTKHEWCRLVEMVGCKYSDGGKRLLFEKWVGKKDVAQKQIHCSDLIK